MTDTNLSRRKFLNTTSGAAAATALAATPSLHAQDSDKPLVVGVIGTGGRGTKLASNFEKVEGVIVGYVCDVDKTRAEKAAATVARINERTPKIETDFRKVLEDDSVDIIAIGTTDHWHAIIGIAACKAGKHVYVEKPCSHNPREGEIFVEASRKYDVRVQMGNQRRSHPHIIEGMKLLHDGAIGKVYYSHCYYASGRGEIGKGVEGPPPPELDFDLWQGPAPREPYRDNILHYNWHWFWTWGTGEIGNNGVHMLDVGRWGLDVDFPTRVTSGGNRYRFDDDQETPDTQVATFEFGDQKMLTWEALSCSRHGIGPSGVIATFIGETGSMDILNNGYVLYDENNKEADKVTGGESLDLYHTQNFVDGVRAGSSENLNAEIDGGHKSTLLCHLGNIAWRTGRTLNCDPKNGHILDDEDAMKLWTREYHPGWKPEV